MFVTIPKPHMVNRQFIAGTRTEQQKIYLNPGEREVVEAAAHKCGVSYSDYFRQCALNVATAMGVFDDTGHGTGELEAAVHCTAADPARPC